MGQVMQLTAKPTLPILLVLSDVFPVKAADIKKDYLAQPPTLAGHPGISTFTIQHPGELGQEAEAEKGVAKLMLLCLQGDVDVRSGNVNNNAFALPALGMQVVMDNPCSGRAVALSNLLKQAFIVTRNLDLNDIRSRELSMIHVSKAMALHLLLGNLATDGVTNVNNEANAVDPSAFLPQQKPFACRGATFQGPNLSHRSGDGRARFAQNKNSDRDYTHRLHRKRAGHNVPMNKHLCSDLSHHHGL